LRPEAGQVQQLHLEVAQRDVAVGVSSKPPQCGQQQLKDMIALRTLRREAVDQFGGVERAAQALQVVA
jgi:hypothetical protein